jgi:hypothetical protein
MTPHRPPAKLGAALTLCLALALGACVAPPENILPLAGDKRVAPDPSLLGTWYTADENEAVYLHILPDDYGSLHVFAVAVIDEPVNPVHFVRVRAAPVQVDGRVYYNARRVGGADYRPTDETPRGTIVVRPDLAADGTLTLAFLSHQRLRPMVEDGRLEGEVMPGEYELVEVPYLMLDLSSEGLADLIREIGTDRLFTLRFGPLSRLPPTPERATVDDAQR